MAYSTPAVTAPVKTVFTREDVDRLRDYPELYGGIQGTQYAREWDAFVNSVADRIAALIEAE